MIFFYSWLELTEFLKPIHEFKVNESFELKCQVNEKID